MEYKRARLFLLLLAVAGAVQMFVSYVYFSDVAFLRHFLQQNHKTKNATDTTWENFFKQSVYNVSYDLPVGHEAKNELDTMNLSRQSVYNVSDGLLVVEVFPDWTTQEPFDLRPTKRVYLYSALTALQDTPPTGSHVRLVTFVDKLVPPLACCMMVGDNQTVVADAIVYLLHLKADPNKPRKTKQVVFFTMYQCTVPFEISELDKARVTLIPVLGSCPNHSRMYLPVEKPEVVPGGIALCAKMAFGHELKANRLVEWFELQRLMGVDKIQLFDLGNTQEVYNVTRHYQDSGFLIFLPLKLPGFPWGRTMVDNERTFGFQMGSDSVLSIMECRLRLAGYDYIISIDLDEVILPVENVSLKAFVKMQFAKDERCAALQFWQKFFIEDWEPANPQAPLHVLRFINCTEPTTNRHKYIYRPAHVTNIRTHYVTTAPGFHVSWVNASIAFIHHYRKCPKEFKGCKDPPITEMSVTRFQETLIPRVKDVMKRTGLQP